MIGKILVTGGAGYIGSHLVKELCDRGYDVIIFDNLSLGREENIDPRAEFVLGDINRLDQLNAVFEKGIDTVFHFAAWKAAGESMTRPVKYSFNNIVGTLNLLCCMVSNDVKNIVFSSSAAVYGAPEYLPVDEKHSTEPLNYYGYTKLAIEQNLEWYSKLKGINYAALRYFNAAGYDVNGRILGKEKNPQNLLPIVMEAVSGQRTKLQIFGNDYDTKDGTCVRDYIHVNDLANAHILAMDYIIKQEKNLIVNLGTGNGHSVLEVVNIAKIITGREISYEIAKRREGDPPILISSSQLANELLGWKAEHSDLHTLIKSMIPLYF